MFWNTFRGPSLPGAEEAPEASCTDEGGTGDRRGTTGPEATSTYPQPQLPRGGKSQSWAIFGQTGKRKAEPGLFSTPPPNGPGQESGSLYRSPHWSNRRRTSCQAAGGEGVDSRDAWPLRPLTCSRSESALCAPGPAPAAGSASHCAAQPFLQEKTALVSGRLVGQPRGGRSLRLLVWTLGGSHPTE